MQTELDNLPDIEYTSASQYLSAGWPYKYTFYFYREPSAPERIDGRVWVCCKGCKRPYAKGNIYRGNFVEDVWSEWVDYTKQERVDIKRKYFEWKERTEMNTVYANYINADGLNGIQLNMLSTLTCSTTQDIPEEEEDIEMSNEYCIYNDQISYLSNRARNIHRTKDAILLQQFYMQDDPTPRTGKELVERIQAGKFTLSTDERSFSWSQWGDLTWRDPANKKDTAGYEAATAALVAAMTAVKDAIAILPAAEALAKVQEFEKWTYTPA